MVGVPEVSARFLGSIVLSDILTGNAGTPFGLAADKIAALTIYQGGTVQKRLANLDAPADDFSDGDFVVRVV